MSGIRVKRSFGDVGSMSGLPESRHESPQNLVQKKIPHPAVPETSLCLTYLGAFDRPFSRPAAGGWGSPASRTAARSTAIAGAAARPRAAELACNLNRRPHAVVNVGAAPSRNGESARAPEARRLASRASRRSRTTRPERGQSAFA
jgi:hypothetical protein